MFVPTGTRLTWVGYFDETAFYNQNVTDALQLVASGLRNKYNLIIEASAPDAGLGSYTSGAIAIQLRSDLDRGNGSDGVQDIGGNVADEFALSGNACSSYRINPPVSGGSPAADASTYDTCSSLTDKFRNALPTWLGGTPVTGAQQACYTKQGQASVQTVADVSKARGVDIQAQADKQKAGVAGDTVVLTDAARKAAEANDKTTLYVAIGAGMLVLIVVLVVAVK